MQLLEPASKSSKPGEGFDVMKSGDARVALIGFPSVGKSTLLSKITKTESEVAAYEYTTLTAIPGVIEYHGARIQLLDLPGIIEGAAQGRGRGKQVVSVAKTADLIMVSGPIELADGKFEGMLAVTHTRSATRSRDTDHARCDQDGAAEAAAREGARGRRDTAEQETARWCVLPFFSHPA